MYSLPVVQSNRQIPAMFTQAVDPLLKSEGPPPALTSSSTSKVDEVTKSTVGRGITGLGSYILGPDTDPELWDLNMRIYTEGKKEGLDPFPVVFLVDRRDYMLSAAARGGFPVTMPHWKHGQEFNRLQKQHEYGVVKIFEMVTNNNPSYAYLQRGNNLCDQKFVIAHVYAHSDFFKNNMWFKHTNRRMMDREAEHAAYCDDLLSNKRVKPLELERFLERAFSIEDLIDTSVREPRKLEFDSTKEKEPEPLPDDFGTYDTSDMPKHIARRFNDPKEVADIRREEVERRKAALRKSPEHPDRDVIGFIIEHSPTLLPWQRMILSFVREKRYYLNPQGQTKIMNEGWASYWDARLLRKPGLSNPNEFIDLADHKSGQQAMSPQDFNPYKVGLEIFKSIEERWNKGQHGTEWDELEDRKARKDWDTKEMKGREKMFEVRRWYKDYDFIAEFLTREVAEDLQLFTIDYDEETGGAEIGSREFQAVKSSLLEMLSPLNISVIDGNHNNRGQLLLRNISEYELKNDYTVGTLKNIHALWGRPVHLDTIFEDKPVRYSIDIADIGSRYNSQKGYSIKVFKLKKEEKEGGKFEFVIDGSPISETEEKFDEELPG